MTTIDEEIAKVRGSRNQGGQADSMDAMKPKLAFVLPSGEHKLQAWDIFNTKLIHEMNYQPYEFGHPLFGGTSLAHFILTVEHMGFVVTNKEMSRGEPVLRVAP